MRKWQSVALAAAVAAAGLGIYGATANAQTTTVARSTAQTVAPSWGGDSTVAANEREVRGFIRTVLDEHQANKIASFFNANASWSGGTVGTITGRANVAGLFGSVIAALPNAHATVEDVFGQGDEVMVRLVMSGTQAQAILGIPDSGRSIHWDAIDVFQLKHGKISNIWAGDDWTAILYYTGTYKAPWIS